MPISLKSWLCMNTDLSHPLPKIQRKLHLWNIYKLTSNSDKNFLNVFDKCRSQLNVVFLFVRTRSGCLLSVPVRPSFEIPSMPVICSPHPNLSIPPCTVNPFSQLCGLNNVSASHSFPCYFCPQVFHRLPFLYFFFHFLFLNILIGV